MEFQRLHEGFGAEVFGFDVMQSRTAEEIEALRAARDEYQLLLFRCDRRIEPERQVEITRWFGPIMGSPGRECGTLANENEDPGGTERLPFHLDYSFTETPFKGITLQGVDVPPAGTTTEFVSNVHNWATLPEDLQLQLAPLTLRHSQVHDAMTDTPEFSADHPVRLIHPRTGRSMLFVTQYHAHRILELDADESARMLARLFDHMYAPERVYEHRWRRYDFLILDNLAMQHARPKRANLSEGARTLQRVTNCEFSFDEVVDRARRRAKERQASGVQL